MFYLDGVQGEMWKRVVVVILPRRARGNANVRGHLGCLVDTLGAPVTILLFFEKKSCLIRIVLILSAAAMKQCGSTKAEQPEPGSVRCPLLQRRN